MGFTKRKKHPELYRNLAVDPTPEIAARLKEAAEQAARAREARAELAARATAQARKARANKAR